MRLLIGGWILCVLILTSCMNQQAKVDSGEADNKKSDSIDHAKKSLNAIANLDLVINSIPSPVEVATILALSGAPYDHTLLNPTDKADKYTTIIQKAFNIGIYGADLNYAIVYDQPQDVLNYLAVVEKLAEQIDVAGAVNKELLKRVEKNIHNKDSLISLTFPIYRSMDNYLHLNEQDNVAAMILSGGWIEGLYIATKVINHQPVNDQNRFIYQKVIDQEESLSNLLILLQNHKNNPPALNPIINSLKNIQKTYLDGRTLGEDLLPGQIDLISNEINLLRALII